jgi:N-acetylglucosamine kinase-like BadF-type ATPase
MATIAVDIGQSGSRALAVGGGAVRRGQAGGFWSDAVPRIVLAAVGAVAASGAHDIGIGLSGYHRIGDDRARIVDALAAAGYRGTVTLADDAVTAHLGAFDGGAGAVVAAGTGAVVLYGDQNATVVVDGLGHELGDRGSGYWIGRRALSDALLEEESGRESALLRAARRALGEDVRRRIITAPPSVQEIASFAHEVAQAAQAGDAAAEDILATAGIELARSVTIALERAGAVTADVSLIGGLAAAGRALTEALAGELPAGCRLVQARGDALDGALLLARRPLERYGELVSRYVIDDAGGVSAARGGGG